MMNELRRVIQDYDHWAPVEQIWLHGAMAFVSAVEKPVVNGTDDEKAACKASRAWVIQICGENGVAPPGEESSVIQGQNIPMEEQ